MDLEFFVLIAVLIPITFLYVFMVRRESRAERMRMFAEGCSEPAKESVEDGEARP